MAFVIKLFVQIVLFRLLAFLWYCPPPPRDCGCDRETCPNWRRTLKNYEKQLGFSKVTKTKVTLHLVTLEKDFERLVLAYRPLLTFIAFKVLENYHTAEDAVQEALLKAYQDLADASEEKLRTLHSQA